MIFDDLSRHGVVPVIAIDDAAAAMPLADALIAGGLPVAEITFRTAAARDAIAAIAAHRPQIIVGAGTVLDEAQVDASVAAGARFALSRVWTGQCWTMHGRAGSPSPRAS